MKKLLFLIMMLAVGVYAQAQQLDVCTKPYGEEGNEVIVIKPTVANFLQLLSMNEEQFKAVMEANKYGPQMPRGNFIAYWNGSNDNFAYAKCVNSFMYNKETKEVHFTVGNDMVYPQGTIMQLYRDLRPYQVRDEAQQGAPRPGVPRPGVPQPGAPQAGVPQPGAPQTGAQSTPQGNRPGGAAPAFGRGRRAPNRGLFGRGRGGFDRPRTDTYEVKDEKSGDVYTFSIAAFPRFLYVTASKKKE